MFRFNKNHIKMDMKNKKSNEHIFGLLFVVVDKF